MDEAQAIMPKAPDLPSSGALAPETRAEEARLADGLRQGDPAALADLVRRFLPGVVRQARSILGSTAEADDAAQEVFMKAIRGGPSLRGHRVRPWLASITHHHCLNLLQARQRHPEIPVEHLPESCSTGSSDIPGAMPDILQGLTGIEREVVLLRIVEEMEYEEIAQITSLAVGSLRNVLSRALHKLRQEVDPGGV
jgi:RNA polymerase sigma-70 factor (ECF subfamily)